jgi:hypothetical protein
VLQQSVANVHTGGLQQMRPPVQNPLTCAQVPLALQCQTPHTFAGSVQTAPLGAVGHACISVRGVPAAQLPPAHA